MESSVWSPSHERASCPSRSKAIRCNPSHRDYVLVSMVQWRYNLTDACFSYDLRNPNGIVKYCEAYQNSLAACMEWDGQGAHYLDTDWYSVRLVNKTDPKLHFCFYIEDSKPPTGNPADCGLNPHILDPLTMEGMTIGGVRVWVPGVIKPI
eukprot:gb/GECG01013575.1/.p1 GENE.gb/GECG01013575.1/~~gb/GECG01013575.1/.p1  ORF type:complete len:151 (+),score=7.22 gb/GECG01013575.1/:1-453(+)